MQANPDANHAAIAAWIEGTMTAAQRQEFAAHLASCGDCQAEVAAVLKARTAVKPAAAIPRTDKPPSRRARRIGAVVICAVLVLALGYALGWWVWGLAHG